MKKYIIFPVFISFGLPIYSQPEKIEKIGLENGLSNSYIMGITQDKKGFMWFSTESGLNRFDGNEFRVYKKTVPKSHIPLTVMN